MASIIRATTTSGLQVAPDNSGSLQLQTNGTTTAVTIDTSQNVGIGTTSPTYKVDVVGQYAFQGTGYQPFITLRDSNASNQGSRIGSVAGITYFQNDNTGGGTYTERMRIDSSGNLLVGTTSNASSAAKMMVSSTAPQMAIDGNGAGVNSLINWTTSGTTKAQTFFDATNTRFYIACNNSGGVYLASGGTSWTAVSDERVKDIIEPITDAANKVSTLRAVIGKYKTDAEDTRRSFLIAQDIQAVLPEAVDATNPENLGVQYTDVIPLLVAAIQEQQTIINDLKARIETLEAK